MLTWLEYNDSSEFETKVFCWKTNMDVEMIYYSFEILITVHIRN